MYFSSMPNIVYPISKTERIVIKDIFRRVASRNNLFERTELEKYTITDGDTPENLAYRYYGSTQYYWVILLCNDIVDPREDWPKSQSALLDFVTKKYGDEGVNEIHHYNNLEGLHVDYDPVAYANGDQVALSNYDYEFEINDSKRNIVLLRNNRLIQFVDHYQRLITF